MIEALAEMRGFRERARATHERDGPHARRSRCAAGPASVNASRLYRVTVAELIVAIAVVLVASSAFLAKRRGTTARIGCGRESDAGELRDEILRRKSALADRLGIGSDEERDASGRPAG